MGDGSRPTGAVAKGTLISVATDTILYRLADPKDSESFEEYIGVDSVVHVLARVDSEDPGAPKK
jgi:hypothetical protein